MYREILPFRAILSLENDKGLKLFSSFHYRPDRNRTLWLLRNYFPAVDAMSPRLLVGDGGKVAISRLGIFWRFRMEPGEDKDLPAHKPSIFCRGTGLCSLERRYNSRGSTWRLAFLLTDGYES